MEQAKGIGRSLVDDSKPEESQKVTGRLEALTTQFRQLESVAQTRMARLEAALKCAAAYENEGSEFNRWLVDAEGRLGSLEQLAIASQPLKQQLEDVKVFFDVHTCTFLFTLFIIVIFSLRVCCNLHDFCVHC